LSTPEIEGGRLAGLLAEYTELEARLADPAIHADQGAARKVGRRFAELTPINKTAGELTRARSDLIAANELAAEDADFAEEAAAIAEHDICELLPIRAVSAGPPPLVGSVGLTLWLKSTQLLAMVPLAL